MNMSLDGYCDHTAVDSHEKIHQHYAHLRNIAGVALHGIAPFDTLNPFYTPPSLFR